MMGEPFFSSAHGIAEWLQDNVLRFEKVFKAHPDQAYYALAECDPPPPEPDRIVRAVADDDEVDATVDAEYQAAWRRWGQSMRTWVVNDSDRFFVIFDERCVSDIIHFGSPPVFPRSLMRPSRAAKSCVEQGSHRGPFN